MLVEIIDPAQQDEVQLLLHTRSREDTVVGNLEDPPWGPWSSFAPL